MSAFGDFTVVRSTPKYVLNSSGVLASVANNVPAFEFNTDGTYRGLLVEPAGTNFVLQSQTLDTTWVTAGGATVTANTAVSPDGTTTADTIALSTTANSRLQQDSLTLANSTTYTLSCFFKNIALTAGQTFDFELLNLAAAPNDYSIKATIDLFAGTATYALTGTATTGTSGVVSGSVEDYGNGWYRIRVSGATGSGAGTAGARVRFIQPSAGAARSFYAWGAQLEEGSVATSYMPTVGSTANRGADSVTLTGASSLIGQTEGTLYAEVDSRMFGVSRMFLENSSDPNESGARRRIGVLSTNTVYVQIGSTILNCGAGVAGINKVALVYSASGFAGFHNGVKYGPNVATPSVDVASRINIGSTSANANIINGHNRSVANFPTALSDAQAIALTTL